MKRLKLILLLSILLLPLNSYGMAGSSLNDTEFAYNSKASYSKTNGEYTTRVGNLYISITLNGSYVDVETMIKQDDTVFTPQEIKIICSKYSDNDWRRLDPNKPNVFETRNVRMAVESGGKMLIFSTK